MNELMNNVSWLAVLVGFILSYLLGWLWYSPKLFGPTWAQGVAISMAEGSELPKAAMITQALATLGLSWVFAITVSNGAFATIALIMTTLMLFIISNGKYAQKSNAAVSIEASYIAAMGVVMLVCQLIFIDGLGKR